MIKPGDFALLENLEQAPDGLYKLIKFDFDHQRAIKLCFKDERGHQVELGLNDIQHIERVLPTQSNSKIKIS